MKRKKPLQRKTPLKRSGRLRPFSNNPRKVERRKLYEKNRDEYFTEHPKCEICEKAGRLDLHHKAGRIGDNYTNKATFMAVCRQCHDYIHRNPRESRQKGWITT